MKKGQVKLSVVVPCFNEAGRLGDNLQYIFDYLRKKKYAFEMILVDDGSADQTLFLLRKFKARRSNVHIIEHVRNEGKGAAVKTGVLATAGTYILFLDADMSTPIETLEQCWVLLRRGADIVIGSRRLPSSVLKTPQPWIRMTLGHGFTWLTNTLLGLHVTDITCGFKVLKKDSGKKLFRLLRRNDWSFDAEMLYLARRHRMMIGEVPVEWTDVQGTKVNLVKDIIGSFFGLLLIRLQH